ncbi:MAG: hypothetical protein IJV17_02890 [Prevotella sp.]|nr:hypothetical protein [Prevotella sp.]
MNTTRKVFLLILGVVLCLLLMHHLPTFSINGMESRPVDLLSDLRPTPKKTEKKTQSIGPKKKAPVALYRPKGVVLIEDFSHGKAGGMNHFYERLLHAKNSSKPIRIAYFGDSFVEGDILTCDLREQLQTKYGGEGPGWADAGGGTGSNRGTLLTRFQNIKENVVTKKPFDNQLQAINQRYYYATDGASLKLTGTKFRPHAANWQTATLFFRTAGGLTVETTTDNGTTDRQMVTGSDSVQVVTTKGPMTQVSYRFPHINRQTQLFGVALDGTRGVALDNFSMRGVPGFSLANIPVRTLKEIGTCRPYDLIVLHFGLNVCTEKTTDAMCRHYINRMKNVIATMREAFPEASIVVFSVPDRVQRSADGFHSISGVLRLVEYQRVLASECDVAYLNIHQIMGGKDSMKGFVDKGLAAKDYTHLNYKGGKLIAGHIFQSILAGVENYRREQNAK